MRWLDCFETIASGLHCQRVRMDVIAQNLANANTTRTPAGGPYRRKEVIFECSRGLPGIKLPPFVRFAAFLNAVLTSGSPAARVRVAAIEDDPTPPRRVYDPGHPDADAQGYVLMPNVEVPMEMVDLMAAARAYEANAAAMQTVRQSMERALELLR